MMARLLPDPMRRSSVAGLALGFVLNVGPASAAEDAMHRSAARQLGEEGVAAYEAGDYDAAMDKLSRAYEVWRIPTLGLALARAHQTSGKWVEAAELYLEVSFLAVDDDADAPMQRAAQQEALKARDELLPQLPKLQVMLEGATEGEVSITLDDALLAPALVGQSVSANPGTRRLLGIRGSERSAVSFELKAGEVRVITLEFQNDISASRVEDLADPFGLYGPRIPSEYAGNSELIVSQPDSQRRGGWHKPVGWTGIALGAAGLVVGGVGLGMFYGNRANLSCVDLACRQADIDRVQSARTGSTLFMVGLISTPVFLIAGTTILLTAPSKSNSQLALSISSDRAILSGTF